MTWEFTNDRPIYSQIIEKIQLRIVSGFYPPGAKLPSVRELASEAGVNPNTMQKAFSELERSGLLTTIRTSGRTVTEDNDMIQNVKEGIAKQEIKQFFHKMSEIGFNHEQIILLAERVIEEEKNE